MEQGDTLTRDEFERRYDAMPELKKAELIEGVVYMPSPVRVNQHGSPHFSIIGCLFLYQANTPGVRGADNTSVRLDLDNEPQPDVVLFIDPKCGGQAHISDDDYIEGAPELVAEIAASTVSIDLNAKFQVYRRNGIREYVVWRVQDSAVDWFVLRGSQYQRLQPAGGVYQSKVFPGLWLDVEALTGTDLPKLIQTVQQGLATPEHAAFVKKLHKARGAKS